MAGQQKTDGEVSWGCVNAFCRNRSTLLKNIKLSAPVSSKKPQLQSRTHTECLLATHPSFPQNLDKLFPTNNRWVSQVTQWGKNLPAMQETQEVQVLSLSWEDPLEKGMATHSSILAWRILWTEEPGRLWSIKSQRVGHD